MKLRLTIASLAAATLLLPVAHGQMTGTSHPEQLNDQITTSPSPSSTPHYVKPSPYIPATAPAGTTNSYAPPEPASAIAAMPVPVPAQPAEGRRLLTTSTDPDANIVTSVPDVPGQLNVSTTLRARLQTPLSTQDTHVGDTFLAELVQPVTQHGVVLIPVGSQIRGRVSEVHGGRRFTGRASIRLQPDFITFPDGTSRRIHAELIDLDNFANAHVNSEGTVVGTEHPKATLAAIGLSTAGATAAGAVIGGGVGAGIGAAIGVGAGTVVWLKRDVQQELPVGTGLVFSLDEPLAVTSSSQTAELAH
ncbi:MAG TPA: hypothetical protein VN734_14070 [Acidobacteriaceae bacterium]|nr:hypothetical protein [Acidobacteriaceae bacterium]